MVAAIKTGPSIHRTFDYNEQKVKEGVAECIMAANYPKDLEFLTLTGKLNRLLHQTALYENVPRNSVYISLNFDPSEKIPSHTLREIALVYMDRFGFGDQPYLVYQHHDAGHPHIHIVSIKIRPDVSRIDTQNIGRNQSEKVRKIIEQNFGLVKADRKKQTQNYQRKPIGAEKAQYGKRETKKAITTVLDAVLSTYKYTSFPELNAVLKQYNVKVDRGNKESRIYQTGGLVYRVIDANGDAIDVPIKASDFYNKPTLKTIEARYQDNDLARQHKKVKVKNAIDLHLFKGSNLSVQSLVSSLEKQGIQTVLRQNEQGILYGITYVDHQTKCVFNGSDLGKQYSAKAIQERCSLVYLARKYSVMQVSDKLFMKAVLVAAKEFGYDPFIAVQTVFYMQELRKGRFAVGAPTDVVKQLTGREPESFESVVREFINNSHSKERNFSNRINAIKNFLRLVFTSLPSKSEQEQLNRELLK